MLLWKLKKIAFLLKDLKLEQFFKKDADGGCDVEGLVNSLDKDTIIKIAEIATGDTIVNEVDAVAGLVNFFLLLKEELITSPQVEKLVRFLPLVQDQKQAILRLLGKI